MAETTEWLLSMKPAFLAVDTVSGSPLAFFDGWLTRQGGNGTS